VAKIDEFNFGSIIVAGKKYRRDVLIFADGTVQKRKGRLDAVARLNELAES
jgi:hypothetical protein